MKNSPILLIALLALLITVDTAQGQERGERVEALKVSFITEQLSLTPDEARVFWPVFNQFEDERKALRQQYRTRAGAGQQNTQNISESQAATLISNELEFQTKDLNLTKKYINEFRGILPVKKVAMLMTVDNKFKRMLLAKIKQGQK
ncbi:MAG: hypothetical protein GY751_04335 [Bacteroidetes bacterium]|nr:hypothetical protein [Bacteroidota bacterium]